MVTKTELVKMSALVYDDEKFNTKYALTEWQPIAIDFDNNGTEETDIYNTYTGFNAVVYKNNNTNEIVISYRGTDSKDIEDWYTNIQIAKNEILQQYNDARYLYELVSTKFSNSEITLTGHSLGGALAQLVGADTESKTVTFNSPGVKNLLNELNLNTSENYENITNYNIDNDILNLLNIANGMQLLGTTYIIETTNINPLSAHMDFDSIILSDEISYSKWYNENIYLCNTLETIEKTNINENIIKFLVNLQKTMKYIINVKSDKSLTFSDLFTSAKAATPKRHDPLLVDLDGDGIETTKVANGVYFDHKNDGFAEKSAWVGQDDGILVVDRNNNGIIDNGTELLGDQFVLSDGTKATSGFAALSSFDSNEDLVIDENDELFNQIKVLKGDGTLLTLEQAGISSISLTTTTSNTKDSNGNTKVKVGSYTTTDGQTRDTADYIFQSDLVNSIATNIVEVPEDYLAA